MNFSHLACNKTIRFFQSLVKMLLTHKIFPITPSQLCFPTTLFFVPLIWSLKVSSLQPLPLFYQFLEPSDISLSRLCSFVLSLSSLTFLSPPLLDHVSKYSARWIFICLNWTLFQWTNVNIYDRASKSLHLNSLVVKWSNRPVVLMSYTCSLWVLASLLKVNVSHPL